MDSIYNTAASLETNTSVPLLLCGYPNASVRFAVLAGVIEQVAEHLNQPYWVAVQVHGLPRHCYRELVAAGIERRTASFDGLMNDRPQFDPLSAKFDLAPVGTAHVEQVIHQADQVTDLTVHDLARRRLLPCRIM